MASQDSGPRKVVFRNARFEDDPIPARDILRGKPTAKTFLLHRDADGRYTCGIWDCSPGTFRWTFEGDEFVYFVEGEARVEYEDGRSIVVRKGEAAHFPTGRCVWTVRKTVKKVFVARS